MSKTPYATETARAILKPWRRHDHSQDTSTAASPTIRVEAQYSQADRLRQSTPCHNMSETNKIYQLTKLESRKTTCADCRLYPCPTTDPTDQGHGFKPALLPLCFAFRPRKPRKETNNANLHL